MFDSKRPLKIGVIAGIVVLIVIVVALVRGGGDGSPIDTAMAFYRAGNEGDYDKAYSYLAPEAQMGFEMMGMLTSFDNAMDDATKGGDIARIESKQAIQYSGAYATVRLAIYYRDGDDAGDVLTLTKVDGRWRIFTSTLLLTPSSSYP